MLMINLILVHDPHYYEITHYADMSVLFRNLYNCNVTFTFT